MTDPDLSALSPHGRYLHHCAEGKLAFQRSASGRAIFYPRIVDPETGGAPTWEISTGKGEVHAVSVVYQKGEAPYALALVELEEGFRLMTHIVDTDTPEAVRIGDRVEVAFRAPAEGQPVLPVFTLSKAGEAE